MSELNFEGERTALLRTVALPQAYERGLTISIRAKSKTTRRRPYYGIYVLARVQTLNLRI